MPRFNCCQFNHPCPIFCPFIDFTCSNNVINPNFDSNFGFFNNLSVGTIAPGGILPVNLVASQGSSILPSGTAGSVLLSGGIFEINYFAGGVVPASGTMSVGLLLNGTQVAGSQVSVTSAVGETLNLTRTIVVTVAQPSVLSLQNTSQEAVDFNFASIFIRRL